MRARLGHFLLASVIGTFHESARAQATKALHVERAKGAEGCPDAENLAQRVAAIRGRPQSPSSSNYEVGFSRTGDTFSALIRSVKGGEGQRILEGRGTCSALAQATAVTLALLFDSEAEGAANPEAPAAPLPPHKPEKPPTSPLAVKPALPRAPLAGTLSLGAAASVFGVRPLSAALTAELGIRGRSFRAGLGVLWAPTQAMALESGQMQLSLLSGTARACMALTRGQGIELDFCSGLFAGVVTAQAEGPGISNNAAQTHPYLALPLELSLAQLTTKIGWEVSAAALAGLAHRDFEVEGLPSAYRPPRIGAMLTVRAVGLWPW